MPLSESTYVEAKLTLRTTEEGGRKTGIKTGYRPNHVFEYNKDGNFLTTYIGEIQFDPDKTIMPGETAMVTVHFLLIPEVQKYLTVGRHWFIHEGSRLLGNAEITKVP